MNRTFQTLLLWILMIALPMQATAAVMKASCGSSHHAMQADHMHSDHVSASTDLACKGSPAANADKSIEHDGHSTCSACASCSVAAAPPSAHVKTAEFNTFIKSALASSSVLAGFIPAGPERPPRSFLA
jgi:hypothetical protein